MPRFLPSECDTVNLLLTSLLLLLPRPVGPEAEELDDATWQRLDAAATRAADAGHDEAAAEFLRRAWTAVHPAGAHGDAERFEAIDRRLAKLDRNHKNAVTAREKAFAELQELAAAEEKNGQWRTAQTLLRDMAWLCPWQAAGQVARLDAQIEQRKADPEARQADLDDLKRSGLYSIQRLSRVLEDETQVKQLSKGDALFRDWVKARGAAAKLLAKAGGNYAKVQWLETAFTFIDEAHQLDAERNQKALDKLKEEREKALDQRSEAAAKEWFTGARAIPAGRDWRGGGGQFASPDLDGTASLYLTGQEAAGTYEASVWFHTDGGEEALPGLVFAFHDAGNHGLVRARSGKSRVPGQSTMVYLDVVKVENGEEKVLESKATGGNFDAERWNSLTLRVLGDEVAVRIGESPELQVKFEGADAAAPLGLAVPGVAAKKPIVFGRWWVAEIVP